MKNKNLAVFNPQRRINGYQYPEDALSKRREFQEIVSYLSDTRFMVSLSGLRRTGKTTLAKQVLSHFLLHQGVDPYTTFYYKFSDTDTDLQGHLDVFFGMHDESALYSGSFVIVLDEMQYVTNRQNILINYYEINKNIKRIVTGSASLYINRHYSESLAGRIIDISIKPLIFREYLTLRYQSMPDSDVHFSSEDYHKQLLPWNTMFQQFLLHGEFPEFIEYPTIDQYQYFQQQVLEKIFSKDIELFGFRKKQELRSLYTLLCHQVSSLTNTQTLGADVGVSSPTIKSYLQGLHDMYLVSRCDNTIRSIKKRINAQPKFYATSINMLCSELGVKQWDTIPYKDVRGWIVENYVFLFLSHHYKKVSFRRRQHSEIDFIVVHEGVQIPIEVKYSHILTKKSLSPLLTYCRKHKLTTGWVFYGGEWKQEQYDDVLVTFIPWRV